SVPRLVPLLRSWSGIWRCSTPSRGRHENPTQGREEARNGKRPGRSARAYHRNPLSQGWNVLRLVEQRRFELPTDVSRPASPQTTDPGPVWHLGPSDGPSPHTLCHACLRSLDPVPCAHASGGPPIPGGQRGPFSTALL